MDLAFSSSFYPCTGKRANSQAYDIEIEDKKHQLLSLSKRHKEDSQQLPINAVPLKSLCGCGWQLNLEAYNMGEPIDLVKLNGTWRLQYTSAPDVLILLEAAARLPFFQVGQIFQKFECKDQPKGGVIRNVI